MANFQTVFELLDPATRQLVTIAADSIAVEDEFNMENTIVIFKSGWQFLSYWQVASLSTELQELISGLALASSNVERYAKLLAIKELAPTDVTKLLTFDLSNVTTAHILACGCNTGPGHLSPAVASLQELATGIDITLKNINFHAYEGEVDLIRQQLTRLQQSTALLQGPVDMQFEEIRKYGEQVYSYSTTEAVLAAMVSYPGVKELTQMPHGSVTITDAGIFGSRPIMALKLEATADIKAQTVYVGLKFKPNPVIFSQPYSPHIPQQIILSNLGMWSCFAHQMIIALVLSYGVDKIKILPKVGEVANITAILAKAETLLSKVPVIAAADLARIEILAPSTSLNSMLDSSSIVCAAGQNTIASVFNAGGLPLQMWTSRTDSQLIVMLVKHGFVAEAEFLRGIQQLWQELYQIEHSCYGIESGVGQAITNQARITYGNKLQELSNKLSYMGEGTTAADTAMETNLDQVHYALWQIGCKLLVDDAGVTANDALCGTDALAYLNRQMPAPQEMPVAEFLSFKDSDKDPSGLYKETIANLKKSKLFGCFS